VSKSGCHTSRVEGASESRRRVRIIASESAARRLIRVCRLRALDVHLGPGQLEALKCQADCDTLTHYTGGACRQSLSAAHWRPRAAAGGRSVPVASRRPPPTLFSPRGGSAPPANLPHYSPPAAAPSESTPPANLPHYQAYPGRSHSAVRAPRLAPALKAALTHSLTHTSYPSAAEGRGRGAVRAPGPGRGL
jgi:hypothetical protein